MQLVTESLPCSLFFPLEIFLCSNYYLLCLTCFLFVTLTYDTPFSDMQVDWLNKFILHMWPFIDKVFA